MFFADIVDVQSMWVGGHATCYASRDGGQTWQSLTYPLGEGSRLLEMLDEQTGWAASNAKLVVTTDGGRNWEAVPVPDTVGKIAALALRTPRDGYLLDFDRSLYITYDGGQSWTSSSIGIADDELEMVDFNSVPSAVVHFDDAQQGVVIMNLAGGGNSELLALHTTDGGQRWERHVIPVPLGKLYLSHDGRYLTVTPMGAGRDIIIVER